MNRREVLGSIGGVIGSAAIAVAADTTEPTEIRIF